MNSVSQRVVRRGVKRKAHLKEGDGETGDTVGK